jgi:hypothetical protein
MGIETNRITGHQHGLVQSDLHVGFLSRKQKAHLQ